MLWLLLLSIRLFWLSLLASGALAPRLDVVAVAGSEEDRKARAALAGQLLNGSVYAVTSYLPGCSANWRFPAPKILEACKAVGVCRSSIPIRAFSPRETWIRALAACAGVLFVIGFSVFATEVAIIAWVAYVHRERSPAIFVSGAMSGDELIGAIRRLKPKVVIVVGPGFNVSASDMARVRAAFPSLPVLASSRSTSLTNREWNSFDTPAVVKWLEVYSTALFFASRGAAPRFTSVKGGGVTDGFSRRMLKGSPLSAEFEMMVLDSLVERRPEMETLRSKVCSILTWGTWGRADCESGGDANEEEESKWSAVFREYGCVKWGPDSLTDLFKALTSVLKKKGHHKEAPERDWQIFAEAILGRRLTHEEVVQGMRATNGPSEPAIWKELVSAGSRKLRGWTVLFCDHGLDPKCDGGWMQMLAQRLVDSVKRLDAGFYTVVCYILHCVVEGVWSALS